MEDKGFITVAGKLLQMNEKDLEADLVDLAWRFENILEVAEPVTAKRALIILFSLIFAYMRGKGLRMGNYSGFQKHGITFTTVATAFLKKLEERGSHWYPHIHKVGLGGVEAAWKSLGQADILEIADQILRSKGE